jgi:uncharacterized protein
LTGARLDGALIGGGTELSRTNFNNVSARAASFANAFGAIHIDGADLGGASILCDELPTCIADGVVFFDVAGADLREATIGSLCCSLSGLATAKLDGVITPFPELVGQSSVMDFAQLAAGVGEAGRITFLPAYGQSGTRTELTGQELRQLAVIFAQMQPASAHPSFDCARAGTEVEKAVCADPKLAALDSALSWLWERVEHSPQAIAAQRKWSRTRANCPPSDYVSSSDPLSPGSFATAADPKGCIGTAYAERIRELGPKSSRAFVGSGTYTTDPPLELPKDQSYLLARKFLAARGYREDEIEVENLGSGAGKVSGDGLWGNGHLCGFVAAEAETQRMGSKFRINDYPPAPDER